MRLAVLRATLLILGVSLDRGMNLAAHMRPLREMWRREAASPFRRQARVALTVLLPRRTIEQFTKMMLAEWAMRMLK